MKCKGLRVRVREYLMIYPSPNLEWPMPIGMGILIGIMDMVPYLHTFAIIPTAFLAMLKAADT